MAQTTITKPTVRTTDTAAMRALQQGHNYWVVSTSKGWTIQNKQTRKTYTVSLDGSCTCPHAKRINPHSHCKHFEICSMTEQVRAAKAAEPKNWDLKSLNLAWR